MTKTEASQLVAILFGSFPSARLERTHVDAFVSGISDLDAAPALAAVNRLRMTSKFLPSIAEIREAATAQQHGPRKTGADAYGELLAAVQRHGRYPEVRWVGGEMRMQSPWPPVTPDVARAVRQTWGSWDECCSDTEIDAPSRARFIAAYDGLAERERQDLVAGQSLPAPQSAPARALRVAPAPPVPPARAASPSPVPVPAIAIPRPAPGPTAFQRRMTQAEIDAELQRRGEL